jgi:cytoskeletal protein CcmA (bactofilin family)
MPTVQKSVIDEDEIDTVLEADLEFSGLIDTPKSLLIKGKVSGSIRCGDDLYIAEKAFVSAQIQAVRLVVRGTLAGKARVSESIQILAGSKVTADLECPDIYIEEGAEYR